MEKESVAQYQLEEDESNAKVRKPPILHFPREDKAMSFELRAGNQARRPKPEVKQQMTEESRKIKDDQEFETSTEQQETKLKTGDHETHETRTSVHHH
ncbi:hypothetical protein EPUS_06530 [Endocarpon pusillum Z07020]|uniref:Uncharacterized protein n=1 Tax=Endocarpon pusillum (strain Z07020 / HMAS-L-300199) TaxID=1263415 RepID=U1GJF7_ENDPU|nr:uncharacterized protein EPUS_06530 [Endocarpon pusillum Z07020]ERF71971.1 hypothetical protein EPUS_06530 [Endocarpon pusillum Z07020]